MIRKLITEHTYIPYLIALFFCLHGLQEYLYFISMAQWIGLTLIYWIVIYTFNKILVHFIKTEWRVALMSGFLWMIFFFFSAFHQFLKSTSNDQWVSSYTFLLPALSISIILILFFILKKKDKPIALILYCNLLFSVLVITEIALLLRASLADKMSEKSPSIHMDKTPLVKNKPSIYLLVMDEYTGSDCMLNELNYSNDLDSVLSANGFHVFTKSQSNYNFTTFSILSMFQMNYLSGFAPDKISHKDYLAAERNLYKNPFLDLLMRNDYEFINYSIFDFKGHPAYDHIYLLSGQTMLLRRRTFFSYVLNDLGWHLQKWGLPFLNVWERNIYGVLKHNIRLKEEIVDLLDQPKKEKPYFLYAHFIMPHPPFFYDSTGKLRKKSDVLFEMKNHIYPPSGYIANVKHANKEIIEMIQTIKNREKDNAVIMILGDHGFRTKDTKSCRNFSNFNAIYFPKNVRPSAYPEKITLVNQFRFVYNHLSSQNEPLLLDSTHFLIDEIEE